MATAQELRNPPKNPEIMEILKAMFNQEHFQPNITQNEEFIYLKIRKSAEIRRGISGNPQNSDVIEDQTDLAPYNNRKNQTSDDPSYMSEEDTNQQKVIIVDKESMKVRRLYEENKRILETEQK